MPELTEFLINFIMVTLLAIFAVALVLAIAFGIVWLIFILIALIDEHRPGGLDDEESH